MYKSHLHYWNQLNHIFGNIVRQEKDALLNGLMN